MKAQPNSILLLICTGFLGLLLGCTQESTTPAPVPAQTANAAVDDHSGWWCNAHGIPEEVCSMCSAQAAKDFREKGDWCEEHNRAESQCFICDPSRAEKFAKLYEAKYGKKPPAPAE